MATQLQHASNVSAVGPAQHQRSAAVAPHLRSWAKDGGEASGGRPKRAHIWPTPAQIWSMSARVRWNSGSIPDGSTSASNVVDVGLTLAVAGRTLVVSVGIDQGWWTSVGGHRSDVGPPSVHFCGWGSDGAIPGPSPSKRSNPTPTRAPLQAGARRSEPVSEIATHCDLVPRSSVHHHWPRPHKGRAEI